MFVQTKNKLEKMVMVLVISLRFQLILLRLYPLTAQFFFIIVPQYAKNYQNELLLTFNILKTDYCISIFFA